MEKNIIYEKKNFWVYRQHSKKYDVMVNLTCFSVLDSSYNDKSLAIARVDYLAREKRES